MVTRTTWLPRMSLGYGPTHPLIPRYGTGFRGLTFDGTGILGTGLFSSDFTTWGIAEIVAGLIGMYAVYAMFFQAKQTKYRLEAATGRRRRRRATKYREKAKRLEAGEGGRLFGFL